jgi:hypothetical protein
MRRLLLKAALAAGLVLCAGVPAAQAKPHDKAKVVSHTYRVAYTLSGDYTSTQLYDGSEQYCSTSGDTITTHFEVFRAANFKVSLDGDAIAQAKESSIEATEAGQWSLTGRGWAEGSSCSDPATDYACEGGISTVPDKGAAGTNEIFGRGKGKTIGFAVNLDGLVEETGQVGDQCTNTLVQGTVIPGPLYNLAEVLGPYSEVGLKLSIESLAKHKTFTGDAKPSKALKGWSSTGCLAGDKFCTGKLTNFVHKIYVTQLSK